jgi:branched-chain amino acid transport system substrate-binding protein
MRARLALPRAAALVAAAAAAGLAQDDRYGGTPDALVPHRGSGEPERRFFLTAPTFRGPHGEAPAARTATIGVVSALTGPDADRGARMLEGLALAVDEANAAGGFRDGVPFRTVVRDENLSWGAAGDAAVDLVYDEGALALFGCVEDSASHVLTRVVLKLETPMMNTAGTDPTLTEHNIPWLVRVRPDDRQTCYALAKRIVETDKRERIAVFRANDRYARAGIREFTDAVRRLHRPVLLEERFESKDTSWDGQLERLRGVRPDAIVVWGRAETAGRAVKALRAAGLTQPVYGPERLAEEAFVAAAGAAAEGAVFAFPFDTRRTDPLWTSFAARFRDRFGRYPDPTSAYAYDGARMLLQAVREAGRDRAAIRERLFEPATFEGVTGPVRFDATRNNVSSPVFGRVERGRAVLD